MKALSHLLCVTFLLLSPLFASAQELFRGGVGDTIITVLRSPEGVTVNFPPGSELFTFSLDNPTRVVIDAKRLDLPPTWSTLKTVSDEVVTHIRVAAHPGKVRLVLQISPNVRNVSTSVHEQVVTVSAPGTPLTAQEQITGEATSGDGSVPEEGDIPPSTASPGSTIAIPTPAPIIPTDLAHTHQPSQTTTIEPLPSLSSTPFPALSETSGSARFEPTSTATPPLRPPPLDTPREADAPQPSRLIPEARESEPTLPTAESNDQRILEKIDFETIEGEHLIAFRLSQTAPAFELSRRDGRTFVLSIPHTGIATLGLALPQYPPQQFAGITFVHAQGGEPKLVATIGVERGVKLTAVPNGNVVFIKVDAVIAEQ